MAISTLLSQASTQLAPPGDNNRIDNGHLENGALTSLPPPSISSGPLIPSKPSKPVSLIAPNNNNNNNPNTPPSSVAAVAAAAAAAAKKRRRGAGPFAPLAPDSDDLVFEVWNPAHMEASYQYANQPAFQDEKDEYLATLRQRISGIQIMEDRHAMAARSALQKKYLALYTSKADALRKCAAKELYPSAMGNVLKFEEMVEKEGKKLHRNQVKKERRAMRAAQLKAQKAETARVRTQKSDGIKTEGADYIQDDSRRAFKSKASSAKSSYSRATTLESDAGDGGNSFADSLTDERESTPRPKAKRKGGKRAAADNGEDQLPSGATTPSGTPAPKGKGKGKSKAAANGSSDAARSKLLTLAPAAADAKDAPTKKDARSAAAALQKKEPERVKPPPPPKPPSQKEIRAIARLYSNTYDSVWKDMARRDANKVHRVVRSSANTRLSNLRKTAVLASKEARRWQFKTNKNIKDLQMKAKRGMREMLAFWKRNEREERDLRKRAEKEALELAKKEEEQREARRQARKLNFLITQTELYTHFIGRKISDDDEEDNDNNDKAAGSTTTTNQLSSKDLDFDSDNEEELKKVAMANARSAFADTQAHARSFDAEPSQVKDVNIDSDEMNFQNPTSLGDIQIPQPKLLSCQLKEYQIKGLSWLANLYEQGINGILADEMGLGKTVQSISVMAYLAETYNIWGPFLVISPASTLHNWEQEIRKFVPDFKVLPYWGSAKDRKVLRKFWDHKNVKYTKDSQFHVLVTSYQLVVADASYFQKMKWQYMILDEAQAIKSSSSARWKSLLSFQCRNRLLLTGTPIQNSMQELWALLHFIMPTLFDSHDEFSEWFSKDIESHAQSNTQLNEQQLTRLHMILKPFMLRRLKKHVQSELGDKIEIDVYCELTNRQRELYRTLRSQISVMDLIEKAASGSDEGTQSLMNLVMQFRKVCNHPDLFERADTTSAYSFSVPAIAFGPIREANDVEILYNCSNLISFNVPKLMYRDGGFLDVPCEGNDSLSIRSRYIDGMLSIWDKGIVAKSKDMSFLRLIDTSPAEASKIARQGAFERAIGLQSYGEPKSAAHFQVAYDGDEDNAFTPISNMLLISEANDKRLLSSANTTGVLQELLSVGERALTAGVYNYIEAAYDDKVQAPPITLAGSDRSILVDQHRVLFNPEVRATLYPMTLDQEWDYIQAGAAIAELPASNMYPWPRNTHMGTTTVRMPSMIKFVTDSGKLAKLDQMLPELKANDHRVLVYFQMTKMMDLMEEYLTFRQYKYVRLDGSSKLGDRRDLVNDWQTKPELFVFLLSTRAGGLGINLTAADTVIFYDSDWNPTIDSQAMDRAHRMGQTRQVTVYRLLVKGTIEERMRDRAKQKMHVQQVVMEGGSGKSGASVDFQKPGREVAYWLLDDDATADALIKKKQEEAAAAQGKGKGAGTSTANNSGSASAGTKRGAAASDAGAAVKKQKLVRGIEDMYHEGEGNFDESTNPSLKGTPSGSGAVTPTAGESSASSALGSSINGGRKKGGSAAAVARGKRA